MQKIFPIVLLVLAIFSSSCTVEVSQDEGCESQCEAVSTMCSEVITYEECNNECNSCDSVIMDEIESEEDCGKIKEKMSQCTSIAKEDASNCDSACNNYNNQCLTLVPNADQQLFDQGYESCMSECAEWSTEKVGCMAESQDCPSMTEVCGL